MPKGATAICALVLAGLLGGCGSEQRDTEQPTTAREVADRPVSPPPHWRTISDADAGFTIAAPRGWTERRRSDSLLIRSNDNAIAVTIVADRSDEGRRSAPPAYARRVISELPGFSGEIGKSDARVGGSPYRTALVRARGQIRGGGRPQRISVAVFNRPDLVSYAIIALEDGRSREQRNDRVLARMLRTLRAQPPAGA